MHPIHSIMGKVLGVSVSTAVVICHTPVIVTVAGLVCNLLSNQSRWYCSSCSQLLVATTHRLSTARLRCGRLVLTPATAPRRPRLEGQVTVSTPPRARGRCSSSAVRTGHWLAAPSRATLAAAADTSRSPRRMPSVRGIRSATSPTSGRRRRAQATITRQCRCAERLRTPRLTPRGGGSGQEAPAPPCCTNRRCGLLSRLSSSARRRVEASLAGVKEPVTCARRFPKDGQANPNSNPNPNPNPNQAPTTRPLSSPRAWVRCAATSSPRTRHSRSS